MNFDYIKRELGVLLWDCDFVKINLPPCFNIVNTQLVAGCKICVTAVNPKTLREMTFTHKPIPTCKNVRDSVTAG